MTMKPFLTFCLALGVHLLLAQTVSFTPAPIDLPPSFQELDPTQLVFFDADSDGDEDLLVSGGTPRYTKLFFNDGKGVFSEKESGVPFSQGRIESVDFADVDNDGDLDLLISGSVVIENVGKNITRLYTNDGEGNFSPRTGLPFPSSLIGSVAFSDVDGDEDQDILLMGITGYNLNNPVIVGKLYLNDGLGNFEERGGMPFEPLSYSSIDIRDVDGDDDQDIFFRGSLINGPPVIKLYLNNGKGFFTEKTTPFSSYLIDFPESALADVNVDGVPDVLLIYRDRNPELFMNKNDGLGNFAEKTILPLEGFGFITFADVDGDEDQDMVLSGFLYLNDGSGNFTKKPGLPFEGSGQAIFEDVDSDSDLDVIIEKSLYLNNLVRKESQSLTQGLPKGTFGEGYQTDEVTPVRQWRWSERYYGYQKLAYIDWMNDPCGNRHLFTAGAVTGSTVEYLMEFGGSYSQLVLRGLADAPAPVEVDVFIDGEFKTTVSWNQGDNCTHLASIKIPDIPFGRHAIGLRFANDKWDPDKKIDRNFYLDGLRVMPSEDLENSLTKGLPKGTFGLGWQTDEVTPVNQWRWSERYYGYIDLEYIDWMDDPCGNRRLFTAGAVTGSTVEYRMEFGGDYTRLELRGIADAPAPVEVEVFLDGQLRTTASWNWGDNCTHLTYVTIPNVPLDTYFIALRFANDEWDPDQGIDRNFYLDGIRVLQSGELRASATLPEENQAHARANSFGAALALEVFPNPSQGQATLSVRGEASGPMWVDVYNSAGLKVKRMTLFKDAGDFTQSVDVSGLPDGIYLLRATVKGATQTTRLALYK
jgi:hypothetical protein